MVRANYNSNDLLEDLKFIREVEGSAAGEYLGKHVGNADYVLEAKVNALKIKFRTLHCIDGKIHIDDCSEARISRTLTNTYDQSVKNITEYQEKSKAGLEARDRKLEEDRKNTTLKQHLAALDGYWYDIRKNHPAEFEKCMKELKE